MPGPFFGVAKSEHSFLRLIFIAGLIDRWELGAIFLLIFRCLPAHRGMGTAARGSSRCPVVVRSSKAPQPPEAFLAGSSTVGMLSLASPLGNHAMQNDQSRSWLPCALHWGLDPVQCPVFHTHCTLPVLHQGPGMEEVFQRQRAMRNF